MSDSSSESLGSIFSNYKIPKRKAEDVKVTETSFTIPLTWAEPAKTTPRAQMTPWQDVYKTATDTPAMNLTSLTQQLNTYIVKAPEKLQEVPKGATKRPERTFQDSIPDLKDDSLPKELRAMCQPLFCKLCQSHLNSNIDAMRHYNSKNHDKKLRKYLLEHSEKTGEPLHKKARIRTDNEQDDNPRYSHCELCDLHFTSKVHADQHYMGRNHQKALITKRPTGSGFYDDDGKFHRTLKAKEDPTGRNGIGLAFFKPKALKALEAKPPLTKHSCLVCNITTTGAEHLEMHYNGQKHRKMLAKLGHSTVSAETVAQTNPAKPAEKERKDLIRCRTPSGQYYCNCCNLSLNSDTQFMQHLDSKKHLKNKSCSQKKLVKTSVLDFV